MFASSERTFSGDGSRLLTATDKGRLMVWDWQKEKVIFTRKTDSGISALAALPGSQLMAAGSKKGRLYILDLSKNNPLSTVPTDSAEDSLSGLTFVSDGST